MVKGELARTRQQLETANGKVEEASVRLRQLQGANSKLEDDLASANQRMLIVQDDALKSAHASMEVGYCQFNYMNAFIMISPSGGCLQPNWYT